MLTKPELLVLRALRGRSFRFTGSTAEDANMKERNCLDVLRGLAEKGLVMRVVAKSSSTAVRWALTEEGRKALCAT